MKKAKQEIRQKAVEVGFDTVGFVVAQDKDADKASRVNLDAYLARGNHASMAWMADSAGRRHSPTALWPDARSVVVLGMNYGPSSDPVKADYDAFQGVVSVYAQGSDYHDLLKKRLKRLARWMVETYGCDVKVFSDTAPVMEKLLAARAGLGWQGKHTNLVSPNFGSWLFLGEVFTTLDIKPDKAATDHCGKCDACITACPTGALYEPYKIDARRCISYLTIEHKDHIKNELRPMIGNRVFGCDACLAVCPWNKFAKPGKEEKFHPRKGVDDLRLDKLASLDDTAFRERFAGSPIKRTRRERMVRNALIAIGNSGNSAFVDVVEALRDDNSELVCEAAAWALERLRP